MARILIKNGQNCCFLKTLSPKLQNGLPMVIYTMIEVSKCLEGRIFFAKKSGFVIDASFDPKTAISAMNLKFRAP